MPDLIHQIKDAATFLAGILGDHQAKIAVVLGSGFASWPDGLKCIKIISYSDIPGFPNTTVIGHKGRLILADLDGISILIMQGRFHFYEGHEMATIGIPIRVFYLLGIRSIILTNAAGGINRNYQPGDIMIFSDHINLVQINPLIGPNLDDFGPRFPDASNIYSNELVEVALAAASKHQVTAHKGVYVFVSGPCFETPAEIKMMERIGADVVGMSTVPEALTARHVGMEIIGISLVANLASGRGQTELTHEEVMKTMDAVAPQINIFLSALVYDLHTIGSKS